MADDYNGDALWLTQLALDLDPKLDIMSYRGTRPICAVCQLNLDTILLHDEGRELLRPLEGELL